MEQVLSGYCRTMDAARMVLVEVEDGEADIGCDYECCPYAANCPIGAEIKNILEKEMD